MLRLKSGNSYLYETKADKLPTTAESPSSWPRVRGRGEIEVAITEDVGLRSSRDWHLGCKAFF